MIIGIDVGGTFTDAVLLHEGRLIRKAKSPTVHGNVLLSLLRVLDIVLDDLDVRQLERVVLSTTLVTNTIAEHRYPRVALILMPGPGLSYEDYPFADIAHFIKGAIDFRGREITPVDPNEIVDLANWIKEQGIGQAAIIGKFSNRNCTHELQVAEILKEIFPEIEIEFGHKVSGQLNYPRRVYSTYLNAATRNTFFDFSKEVKSCLRDRGITAPVFILKADGGTWTLQGAERLPVETVLSGPAASTVGALSLAGPGETVVVADIGGTTTDLALILSGEPLLSSKGADINGLITNVRSFAIKSVAVGGDSAISIENGKIVIHRQRYGVAYCLGGPDCTPTDALRYLNKVDIGDFAKAREIITSLSIEYGRTPTETAEDIVSMVCNKIATQIVAMFRKWELEPAYRVWEIINKIGIKPDKLIGVGGAASGLMDGIAKILGCSLQIPTNGDVANAIGAAVAKPTVTVTVRIDTELGKYMVAENGFTGTLQPRTDILTDHEASELTKECLVKHAYEMGIGTEHGVPETTLFEVFNVIRNFRTKDKIYDIRMQTPRDIMFFMNHGEGTKC